MHFFSIQKLNTSSNKQSVDKNAISYLNLQHNLKFCFVSKDYHKKKAKQKLYNQNLSQNGPSKVHFEPPTANFDFIPNNHVSNEFRGPVPFPSEDISTLELHYLLTNGVHNHYEPQIPPEPPISSQHAPMETQEEPFNPPSPDLQENEQHTLKAEKTPPSSAKSWASLFGKPQTYVNNINVSFLSNVENGGEAPSVGNDVSGMKNRELDTRFLEDPFSYRLGEFLHSYELDFRTYSLLPRGLTNRGNYCYINSILQALLSCSPFYNLMYAIPSRPKGSSKTLTPIIDSM